MFLPTILALCIAAGPAPSDTWPGFRGDGSSTSMAKFVPTVWSPTENLAWKLALPGYGQSAPVVWKGLAYVTAVEGDEKDKLFVVAVDTKTGKAAWTKEFAATQKGKNNPMMSRAAPTPVVDGEGVYAFFESGDVIALSPAGNVRWQRSLTKDYGEFKNNHGLGSSPAQTEKAVVVLVDHAGPSYLVALDKATGKALWKADRTSRSSWTSPVVATVDGKAMVIASSGGVLDAYDAADGKHLATLEGLVGNTIPSPTVAGDRILIGSGENRMKPDQVASAKSNCCVRLTLSGEKPAFETVWQGKKAISHHASPVVAQRHAYFVTKTGIAHCIDLSTGEERYAERLDGQQWATPIAANGRVYFFGKDGVTTVVKAGATFEVVSTNRLWSANEAAKRAEEAKKNAAATLPSPPPGKGPGGGPPVPKEELDTTRYSAVGDVIYGAAVVEGAIFIRSGTELFCIR